MRMWWLKVLAKRKRDLDGKGEEKKKINRRERISVEKKRQEKRGLTPAALLPSTLRTAQCCFCCLFTLLSEVIPRFFMLTAAQVKPWRCQWRYKERNNTQAAAASLLGCTEEEAEQGSWHTWSCFSKFYHFLTRIGTKSIISGGKTAYFVMSCFVVL